MFFICFFYRSSYMLKWKCQSWKERLLLLTKLTWNNQDYDGSLERLAKESDCLKQVLFKQDYLPMLVKKNYRKEWPKVREGRSQGFAKLKKLSGISLGCLWAHLQDLGGAQKCKRYIHLKMIKVTIGKQKKIFIQWARNICICWARITSIWWARLQMLRDREK